MTKYSVGDRLRHKEVGRVFVVEAVRTSLPPSGRTGYELLEESAEFHDPFLIRRFESEVDRDFELVQQ